MILYDEALRLLQAAAARRPWPAEDVPLEDTVGRICADRVLSPEPSPPFNNSSMDGFAVRSELTRQASSATPVTFAVRGTIAAGHTVPAVESHAEFAYEIMTGAPIPDAYDAVAKVEDVKAVRDAQGRPSSVTLSEPLLAKQNVRYRGHDFDRGHAVLEKGARVRPDHVMGLASLGITKLSVFRRPRVAVISTGHEIQPFDTPQLAPGQIRNSSGPYLNQSLPRFGFEVVRSSSAEDDVEDFLQKFDAALALKPDLVITTGAVSAGRYDFIKEALSKRDAKVVFHKVAIRPGKPILFAELPSGPAYFGLPGNPISTVVGVRFFVLPFVRALMGLAIEIPLRAKLTRAFEKPEALRCFMKARLRFTLDGPSVEAHAGQPSFMISSLNESNAWAIVPEGLTGLPAGSIVDVLPLTPEAWEIDLG